MRKDCRLTIAANRQIATATYLLELAGDVDAMTPGQFVNLEVPGFYLRRPLSIYRSAAGSVDLIYKVLGEGTLAMTRLAPGTQVQVLAGLGNGFTVDTGAHRPLVVGGGVGAVPLLYLTEELVRSGQDPQVILGFGSADEIFMAEAVAALGVPLAVTTVDGSAGTRGFVTDALDQFPAADYFYACGPTPMLHALASATALPGQISLEERMGCGFGACVGCVTGTPGTMRRVCKEGPIFTREELQW